MSKNNPETAKQVAWAYSKLKTKLERACEGHAPTVALLALIEVFFDYAHRNGLDAATAFTEALAARKVRDKVVEPKAAVEETPTIITP